MTGETPRRAFRIPDAVYLSAQAAANNRGETLTDVVLRCLREYGTELPSGFSGETDGTGGVAPGANRHDSPTP